MPLIFSHRTGDKTTSQTIVIILLRAQHCCIHNAPGITCHTAIGAHWRWSSEIKGERRKCDKLIFPLRAFFWLLKFEAQKYRVTSKWRWRRRKYIYITKVLLLCIRSTSVLRIWARQGAAILVHSLPMKSTKSVARDVFDTFATQSGLVRDVSDTDCQAQNGST